MSSTIAKRFIGITGAVAAGLLIAATPVLTASPAQAYPNNWHRTYVAHPAPARYGWHGGGYGYHPGAGAVVGGALVGLGVGAAIGALAAPPVVYAPPPVYYAAPPPVYYGY